MAVCSSMPTPSSATSMDTARFPAMATVMEMPSGPSSGMAWRTAFSTSGWMTNAGICMSSASSSTLVVTTIRSSPKRAFSNFR
ncbi:Uncharacterised protein [Collinsella intestinalis]|nr:Uncharacterised protein [Collinsella intestinalis]